MIKGHAHCCVFIVIKYNIMCFFHAFIHLKNCQLRWVVFIQCYKHTLNNCEYSAHTDYIMIGGLSASITFGKNVINFL